MDYHTEFGAVGQMVQANVPDVSKWLSISACLLRSLIESDTVRGDTSHYLP